MTVENVTKAGLGNTPDAQYLNEHMIELLFSNDCVNEKRNTQAIEVKPNVLVSARVLEHTAAAQIPFDQVKAQIIAKLKADAAVAAAKAEGEKKLARSARSLMTLALRPPPGFPVSSRWGSLRNSFPLNSEFRPRSFRLMSAQRLTVSVM